MGNAGENVQTRAGRYLQQPAGCRAALHRLVEAGQIEERGKTKGRTWHLSAAAYRAVGEKAAYVRQRGFEPLQQEQMVLQYVEKHGRITRREAAELRRPGPYQATRLLARLVEANRLVPHGTRKAAGSARGPKS